MVNRLNCHQLSALVNLLFLGFLGTGAHAQTPVSTRITSGLDLGFAYKPNTYAPSATYFQLLNVGERKLFSVGYTVRFASLYIDNENFYTAPARLTRGGTGFYALTAPLKPQNIDTLRMDYASNTSLNLGIRAQVNLGRVEIGASADLLGFILGRTRTGRVISSTGGIRLYNQSGADSTLVPFRGDAQFQSTQARGFNVRLLGDNDRGTLATEVFGRVRVSQRMAVKVGYQWITTETRLGVVDAVSGNDRFRYRAGLGYVALTFPFFD